ncbi:MAG: hypothetical protein AAGG48_25595 [Planctomycetota bacterium]
MLELLKAFVLVFLLTVAYGVAHDQVTARVCVEYFTVAHWPLVDTDSPTVLGLYWGVYATWKFGLVLGVASAVLSQVGSWPTLSLTTLLRLLLGLILIMAAVSCFCGTLAYRLSSAGHLALESPMSQEIDAARHSVFLAARWAHRSAHVVGIVGASIISSGIWLVRKRRAEAIDSLTLDPNDTR